MMSSSHMPGLKVPWTTGEPHDFKRPKMELYTYAIQYIYIYKWANALVPPTPFQGWRKKFADIEPLKKASKLPGLNIVKHTNE